MGKELKSGSMEQFSKEIMCEIENQEKESSNGQMVIFIMGCLEIIRKMDKESWNIKMEDNIKEIGLMIKCMEMVNLLGLQAKVIKEIIKKI